MSLFFICFISQLFYGIRIITADVTAVFVNMVFSDEDKILVKKLYRVKEYKALELMNKFSNKCWTKSSINRLLKKFGDTGAVNRLTGSGRPLPALK